ncbi:hypothetical protein A2U01_0029835, partial [Trifolium medium]|nr:hypothetical protein [Trifolium medium]
ECKYLQERDAAQKRVKDIGLQLSELHAAFDDKNKYALQQKLVIDLEATEAKLAEDAQERDVVLTKVKVLEDRVRALEDKLKETEGKSAEDVITEEEKAIDWAGIYAGLNPCFECGHGAEYGGPGEEKEVHDGQVVPPQDEEDL